MAWEFADLFDARIGVREEAGDLLDDYWRSIPSGIRIGSMGYRTRTTKAGSRLEAEIYPVFGRETRGILRAARKNETPERMRKLNRKKAEHRLILLIEENFDVAEDIHMTLTFAGEEPDMKRCRRDVKNYMGRVKRLRAKRGLDELKYVYAIGVDGEDGRARIHVHVIMNGGINREELEKIWGKGYANSIRLQDYGSGLQGVAKYLYRQNDRSRRAGAMPHIRSWCASKNLRKPKVRTSDSKVSRRRVRILAQDFESDAKDIMEKLYPGYVLRECQVFHSDVVDGVYIRCVLRKMGGQALWIT